MAVTRFLTRARIAERMGDFTRHLRAHGVRAGMLETETSLGVLSLVDAGDPNDVRLALKAICASDVESFARFDELFAAYWLNAGKQRHDHTSTQSRSDQKNSLTNLSQKFSAPPADGSGSIDTPDNDNDGEAESSGEGKLIATQVTNRNATDMREFILPEDEARAAETATVVVESLRRRLRRRARGRRIAASAASPQEIQERRVCARGGR